MTFQGLYGVRLDEIDKLARFCCWDHQGLLFILLDELNTLIERIGHQKALTYWRTKAVKIRHTDDPEYDVANQISPPRFTELFDTKLSRKSNDFIRDSLYCRSVYILNLDNETFEVYDGLQVWRHDRGRYAKLIPKSTELNSILYQPCALRTVIPLTELSRLADQVIDEDYVRAPQPTPTTFKQA
jgi:hypothetical protein